MYENKGRAEKGVRYQVPGVRKQSGVRGPNPKLAGACGAVILPPVSCRLTPSPQEMKVHPEMFMKTKDRENQVSGARYRVSGKKVRGPKSKGKTAKLARTFWLLATVF